MGKTLYMVSLLGSNMGRLDLNIDDELERKFRDTVYRTKGMKKGNLTKALEDAIHAWIKSERETKEKK